MANDKQQSGLMFNALTAGSKIVGNIYADSDYRIDGTVEGELQSTRLWCLSPLTSMRLWQTQKHG